MLPFNMTITCTGHLSSESGICGHGVLPRPNQSTRPVCRSRDAVCSRVFGAFVTTAWVLAELANSLARGSNRALFLELYRDLSDDHRVTIVPADHDLFAQGVDLYAQRPDKEWSLTDCISFIVMRQYGLSDALTADRHYEQAGFKVLLK